MSEEAADTAVVAAGLAGAVVVMDRLWHFGGWERTQTHEIGHSSSRRTVV